MQTPVTVTEPFAAIPLPRPLLREALRVLSVGMPPPAGEQTEAALLQRDLEALAVVVDLAPGDLEEIRLACQFVIADSQAMRGFQRAETIENELLAFRVRAQALSLLRESKSSLRLLLKQQEQRIRQEAAQAAMRAAEAKRDAAGIPPRKIPAHGTVPSPASPGTSAGAVAQPFVAQPGAAQSGLAPPIR